MLDVPRARAPRTEQTELPGRRRPDVTAPQGGWLLLEPGAVPERWRGRMRHVAMVPLLPSEADGLLAGRPASPALDPSDEAIARLVARGLSVIAIAAELGMSTRSVQRRLVRLRELLGAESKAELAGLLAAKGFGQP